MVTKITKHKVAAKGIRAFAYHGCLPEEKNIGGEFLVDVIVECDFSIAAATDDLNLTVDYCMIFDIVQEQMKIPSKLIEQVAYRIANKIVQSAKQEIFGLKVRITKINPPVNGPIENVWVEVEA
ncbi:MAG: dihydroneopterin aldolase [Bacteroidota bacterium]|jgi:dihydroneopterin aldolase